MTIEYVIGTQAHVEHVDAAELARWTAEHPEAVIVHAVPEPSDAAPAA
jgi:hypothetical protein